LTGNAVHALRIEEDTKLDFKDVLIRPKRSTLKSRSEVDLSRRFTFRHTKNTFEGVPMIAANMDTTGTFEMVKALSKHKVLVALSKHYQPQEFVDFLKANPECSPFMAISSGTSESDFKKLKETVSKTDIKMLCLDVANGYSEHFVEYLRKVRKEFPDHIILAGNVVTGEMTEELILSGADIVKVGIGPGSVCTTRKQTGVGYPQLSAVIECADAAHGLGGCIVSDGGCTCPGDVAKAFGGGADFVMMGGMLAGHDESAGEVITGAGGKKRKLFYGMSSSTAMKKYAGGVAEYRSSEGKSVEVDYRGPVDATILDLLGGLRSACTYTGASKLKEMSKRTTFIRVTQQLNNVFGSA